MSEAVVFWGVMPCSLVDDYQRFSLIWCLHIRGNNEPSGKNYT
jgi:hypothetical protein